MIDRFYESPGNPVPAGGRAGFLTSKDGKRFRYALFPATANPSKGTILLLHGRNEVIEKYFETIRDLLKRGFSVATLDWRGQGGSDRLIKDAHRGHIKSFAEYIRDLDQFFGEILLPDCKGPFYILAHSAGALIALLAAPSLVNRVRRMVLAAPFLTYTGIPLSMTAIFRLSNALYWIGLGRMYALWGARPKGGTPYDKNNLTSDRERFARNTGIYDTHPDLSVGGPTIAWIRAACMASAKVQQSDFMARINVPILFVGAGADKVVATSTTVDYARRLRGGSLLTIDGARHELMQEVDLYREQFWAAFDAFIPGSDAPA